MKPWKTKLLMHLFLFFAGVTTAMSQLSGTINNYTKVTAVDYLCNFITVASSTGFAAGDKVLIIQMQGATIDQTNSVAFGDITAIGDAGNYEFAVIDHFVGSNVYLSKTLLRTYTVSGSVQMVSVPQYGAVSIDAELKAKAWDGITGGVLVFESSDVVTMNADINVSEIGFRGGKKSLDGGNCSSLTFLFPSNIYSIGYPSVQAGQKGEGIASYIIGKESSTGKNSIGGGGGGSHNTGGGGGGNYGSGGRGGNSKCGSNPYGLAGLGLGTTYYNTISNKIFMGGGGGGGQANNGLSFNGGNGGGIILIKANAINTNGFSIRSNAGSVNSYYDASSPGTTDNGDGNSGGGAGGTILLDVANYSGTTSIEAIGGKGGNTGYLNFDFGPGGGGGGGVVWHSNSSSSGLISANISAGTAGISGAGNVSGTQYGSGTSWGATNGTTGALLNTLSIPQSSSSSSCALPVELIKFQATPKGKYNVQLRWTTASESNNAFFSLEKSADGIHFFAVAQIAGQASSHQQTTYDFTDEVSAYEVLYYKLKQTDIDGKSVDLGIRKVYPESSSVVQVSVYPNPCKDQLHIPVSPSQQQPIEYLVFINSIGETIDADWDRHESVISINTQALPAGLYSLIVYTREQSQTIKVLKEL